MSDSYLESTFEFYFNLLGKDLPRYQREYRFDEKRKWKFDFAWPCLACAIEIEGGTWVKGRHIRPFGFEKDCEKYNHAVARGWRVLRFTADQLKKDPDRCFILLRRTLKQGGWNDRTS